jgi:hypothetical protein
MSANDWVNVASLVAAVVAAVFLGIYDTKRR